MGVVKAKALVTSTCSCQNGEGKDVNAQEDAVKVKYTFREIYDKVPYKTYSAHRDESYKQQTQQNFHSR